MKKIKILIIVLISILILGCAVFAVLYFATDIFKSDKELFYKYAEKMSLNELINLEEYNNYALRSETTAHSNEGNLSIEISQGDEKISETLEYSGHTDPTNKKASTKISLNKDNETLLTMDYLKQEDSFGVKFEDIVSQYIVVENRNLKEFASKIGVENTDNIPDQIPEVKISNYISYNELKSISNKYLNIAIDQIPEESYSEIKSEQISLGDKTIEASGYRLSLNSNDTKAVLTKIFETMKDDEEVYNLINKYKNQEIAFEDYQAEIENYLENISEEINGAENEQVLTISVYKNGRDTVKIAIEPIIEDMTEEISLSKTDNGMLLECNYKNTATSNEIDIKITKTTSSEEQDSWEIIVTIMDDEQTESVTFNIDRIGNLTSDNIEFNVTANTLLEDYGLLIDFKNTDSYTSDSSTEEFDETNSAVINDFSQEQLMNLFTNLSNKIGEKLQNEVLISTINNISTSLMSKANEESSNIQSAIEEENVLTQDIVNESQETMNNQEILVFNAQLTPYEGLHKGTEIKNLISTIEMINASNPNHTVTYEGISADQIESTKEYNVSLEEDSEGYINKVIVE